MLGWLAAKSLPLIPRGVVGWTARRYVAGEQLEDALARVARLNAEGAHATMDLLGEFVRTPEQALAHRDAILRSVGEIGRLGLKSGLSVKLTALGIDVDAERAFDNLRTIVSAARAIGRFVRLDMENSPYTDRTLDSYRRLRNEGFENCGVVIQARLHRSEQDIRTLAEMTGSGKTSIRLCKGIYLESDRIAYRDAAEIRRRYENLLNLILDSGMKIAIATHDDELIESAGRSLRERHTPPAQYEFQMLLGVKEDVRRELVRDGHRVRVYVPYGSDWYGYSVRRLRENPQIAGHVLRAFFRRG